MDLGDIQIIDFLLEYKLILGLAGLMLGSGIIGGYQVKDSIWKERYQNCQATLNETQDQLEICRSDLSECNSDLTACQNENERLSNDLESCRDIKGNLSERLAESQRNASQLYENLTSCRENLRQARDQITFEITVNRLKSYDIIIFNREYNLYYTLLYLSIGIFGGTLKLILGIYNTIQNMIGKDEEKGNYYLNIIYQILAIVFIVFGVLKLIFG
ncbi:MAG: hypothetical protein ABEJ07_03810 [Candidatus Nanohaloarchaea archaeon]